MVEPTNEQVPPVETTPAKTVADPVVTSQPAPAVPDVAALESKLKELEEREKRHKEQLKGKDKLIQELSIKKLVASMSPEEEPTEPIEEPSQPVPTRRSIDPVILNSAVENSIFINRLKMKDEFRNDPHLPFTDEIALEVESKVQELDPTGRAKMNVNVWRECYKLIKAEKTEDIVKSEVAKVKTEMAAQQKKEAESFVETPTPTPDPVPQVTADDVLSGKVKMSTKEMLEKFPEIRAKFSPRILKMFGY